MTNKQSIPPAVAEDSAPEKYVEENEAKAAKGNKEITRWLFVQTARDCELVAHPRREDVYVLTLRGVQPTVRFSDRPVRKTGHESTQQFVLNWEKGPDSFAANPPNAELIIFNPGKEPSAVTLELKDPQWAPEAPNRVTYTVTLINPEASLSPLDGPAALFIDDSGGTLPLGTQRTPSHQCPQTGYWTPWTATDVGGPHAGADSPAGETWVEKGSSFPKTPAVAMWELTYLDT